jgi:hypothetical protein
MKILNKVSILFYPERNRPVNPLMVYPEDLGAFKSVDYVPAAIIHLPNFASMNKQELFNCVPGLQDFVERAFHGKVIVSFGLDVTVIIENGRDLPAGIKRHLADTDMRRWYN